MIPKTDTLLEAIEMLTGVRPIRLTPLHGGCINQVFRADYPDGSWNVVKFDSERSGRLGIEAAMLRYLKTKSELPVPEVYAETDNLLVMSFLEGASRFDSTTQAHAAECFARLHQVRGPAFGFEFDTLIGSLHQPNPWTGLWTDFFREQRLLVMANLALQEGVLPQSVYDRLLTLADQLDDWLIEPEFPALLHGDAWTTNMLALNGQMTGFLDPAIYYGHPEIELTFTTLFGTFGEPFFRRYNELSPIAPGFFEHRLPIYNLYPLLVHARLFGASYVAPIDTTLRQMRL